MSLTAADLLAPQARAVVPVDLPARGGSVCVRALTAGDELRLGELLKAADATVDKLAIQLAAYLCDEAGAVLLTVQGALEVIESHAGADVRAIISAGAKLNKLDDESIEAARKN